jgi:hypothetical protein
MALIIYKNGNTRPAKNLGWLLRHGKSVEQFHLTKMKDGSGKLFAYIEESKVRAFSCEFADYTIMLDWLNRPMFRGLKTYLFTESGKWHN